jgi:hypothetical protein
MIEGYQVPSHHLAGFVKAARAAGVYDVALAKVSAPSVEIINMPFRRKWLSAYVLQELTVAIAETAGLEVLGEINYRMAKESIGPIVMPLLRVALALTGRTPATLFARLDETVGAATKGMRIAWVPQGKSGGTLNIRYPEPQPRIHHLAWGGVFRFLFELTGSEGRVVKHEYRDGDQTLEFELGWG